MSVPHIPVNESYYSEFQTLFNSAKSDAELFEVIVDAPFHDKSVTTMLGLGIIVLLLVNKKSSTIDRIALAKTDMARGTLHMSSKPFNEIKIPLSNKENYIAIAVRSGQYMITSDWQYLFTPELSPEDARFNQAAGGIGCSVIYPLNGARDGAALIFSFYEPMDKITNEHHKFMKKYVSLVTNVLKR
jgi:hypothetical protein